VDAGLLERRPYRQPGERTRFDYHLTGKGAEFFPVLVALAQWGDKWCGPPGVGLRHHDCGASVRAELRCADGHGLTINDIDLVPTGRSEQMVAWDSVTRTEVLRAMQEYDRLGAKDFFAAHGFAPTTTYDLVWENRLYPPKAILGTAYEFATGQRLASADFEGGKSGAVKVLGDLGFTVQPRHQPS
jgi:hypothetical protein